MGRGIRFTTEFKREAVRLALTGGKHDHSVDVFRMVGHTQMVHKALEV